MSIEDQIQNLPQQVDNCPICYNNYENHGMKIKHKLLCGHEFHLTCISEVLNQCYKENNITIPLCPLCRREILIDCHTCANRHIGFTIHKCIVCYFKNFNSQELHKHKLIIIECFNLLNDYSFLWGKNKNAFSKGKLKELVHKIRKEMIKISIVYV